MKRLALALMLLPTAITAQVDTVFATIRNPQELRITISPFLLYEGFVGDRLDFDVLVTDPATGDTINTPVQWCTDSGEYTALDPVTGEIRFNAARDLIKIWATLGACPATPDPETLSRACVAIEFTGGRRAGQTLDLGCTDDPLPQPQQSRVG